MPRDLPSPQAIDSDQTRQALTEFFFNIADKWSLTREQEAQLLGWSYKDKRSVLDAMRKGKQVIGRDQDKLHRLIDLLNIHKSLRVLFPNNLTAVYEWVKLKRERFGNHSALDVMLEGGQLGIRAIRDYLEYERTH